MFRGLPHQGLRLCWELFWGIFPLILGYTLYSWELFHTFFISISTDIFCITVTVTALKNYTTYPSAGCIIHCFGAHFGYILQYYGILGTFSWCFPQTPWYLLDLSQTLTFCGVFGPFCTMFLIDLGTIYYFDMNFCLSFFCKI